METEVKISCVSTQAKTMKDKTSTMQDCDKFPVECNETSEQFPINQSCKDSPRINKEVTTFGVLSLPFAEHLRYQKIRAMSIENENMYKLWKQFLYELPDSENKIIPKINNKFWRWKNYIRYMPNENCTNIKKRMSSGPKLDNVGRLPIPGDQLSTHRGYLDNTLRLKSKNKVIFKKDHKQTFTE